ncbi:MAG: gephyrin-like molybdotransferase Glp [Rhodobacterales bacterium]
MFDTVLIVDWSGGNDRGTRPKKDAIWTGIARAGLAEDPVYHRNRQLAEDWIIRFLAAELSAGRRVLAGFDFAFGYPTGFGRMLTGTNDPFAIWDWFAAHVQDSPQANNRFDLAGQINARFPGIGPFWGNGLARDIPDLPRKGLARQGHGLPEKRAAEQQAKGAFAVWQLAGAGAVGSQVIMGLPVLARLRHRFGADLAVWPFQPLTPPIALVEVWPSLIAKTIAATCPPGAIKDAHQVRVLARALSALAPADLARMLDLPATAEGTILGLDHVPLLEQAVSAPVLRNDCFALPQGVHWTPVDQALAHLRQHLPPVAGVQPQPLAAAAGRYLAQDVSALRAHPPSPNAAVDGYGFAGPAVTGAQSLTLVQGRAAAGQPFAGVVPAGHAIRILTGANLPQGVDTVVMQEDVQATDTAITFQGPLKRGANARAAGEDMTAGQIIARQGRRLTPADLGMCAAAGIGQLLVYRPLRVGILSTGDELRDPGSAIAEGQIFDANRPMLAALVRQWGHDAVDLGRAPDDRNILRGILDQGAATCDVILTSGGASAGDEDHMSALLAGTGSLALWRVAMKPGRPLAMGVWDGKPVLGLPGNPVAAMVCALVFAYPALAVMAGGKWPEPQGFTLPAAFAKTKKAGRREYLRARIRDGRAEVFASEGSGRVSGLAWADGLVMLPDAAMTISPGDPVTYIPFDSFR